MAPATAVFNTIWKSNVNWLDPKDTRGPQSVCSMFVGVVPLKFQAFLQTTFLYVMSSVDSAKGTKLLCTVVGVDIGTYFRSTLRS